MEIDLELPSQEEDKLHTVVKANIEFIDTTHGMHVDSDNVNSRVTSEHAEEVCGSNTKESESGSRVQVAVNTIEADIVNTGAVCEPQNGLEFDSKEAAYSFYREYARSIGFGITIKASRRSKKSGKFIDVKIACSRFGNRRESSTTLNPQSCLKTGCKAGLHMKRRQDEKWIIYSFVKEHNHEICPADFYNAIKGRNKQTGAVACQKKGLQLSLEEGDVQSLLEHFMFVQDENPYFFFTIDLDNEKRMRNVFWVDAKGRLDYCDFCDVVFFDTFYIDMKYKIPFAPIIGVNHHFQFMLLGCALIGDETQSTFVWLMRSWLKAMGGKAPRVIITNQDKMLNEAVADVFPDSCHCFCLWHVLRKIPEKLGHVINQYENFMAKFNKCVYQSSMEEQFEKRWWKMVDKFELRENEWIQSLYEDRRRWVPTYMRNTFLAGMSTTERSGSVTCFFDKYLHREATFKEFFMQYKVYLQDRCEMDAKAGFDSRNNQPELRSLSAFEKQMSTVYTDTIFKKFQVEVLGVVSCHLQKESEDETTIVYRVDDFEERQNFFVAWNKAPVEVCCSCHSFEYRGLLCKHAILVLQMSGISNVPAHYILKRWTKDAKIGNNSSEISIRPRCRVQRFNELCKRAIKLVEEGSLSQEAYIIAFQALVETFKHCVGVKMSVRSKSEPRMSAVHGSLNIEEDNHGNRIAKSSKKYKKRKVRSEPEGLINRLQESCPEMEQTTSRGHTLVNCYVPQQDMQRTELNSRAPTLDGYYVSQQSMQEVGNLNSVSPMNSVSPICDGYYGNQHGMQGLGHLHSLPARVSPYGTQQSMQGMLQGQLGFRASVMYGGFNLQDSLGDMPPRSLTARRQSIRIISTSPDSKD